jgi:hypothetical protein
MFQFIFMPLIAFGLGFVFPSSAPEMRLGLFVTGTVTGCSYFNICSQVPVPVCNDFNILDTSIPGCNDFDILLAETRVQRF